MAVAAAAAAACGGGRAGGVGAAADEIAPPPAFGDGATSEVRGDAHTMLCNDNALDSSALTSFAIAHPALGVNSRLTRVPSSHAVALKINLFAWASVT